MGKTIYKIDIAGKFILWNRIELLTIPKETNPAFANNTSTAAPFSSKGGEGDHEQGGALTSPAVRLASTNS